MNLSILIILSLSFSLGIVSADDAQCGKQADGALCPNDLCCSNVGYCGNTTYYCCEGCQSQCWNETQCGYPLPPPPPPPISPPPPSPSPTPPPRSPPPPVSPESNSFKNNNANAISKIISESLFNKMFKHRKDCPSQRFYTYKAFITAAVSFPGFGTTGDVATRKRELAAFFGQTSQATTGQRSDSIDPHAWGYCHINGISAEKDYCTSSHWPCASGKKYNGRGPIQLTHNYNYGLAGEALGIDLINDPDLVSTDPVISFKTAIWYWMTQHENKPSCHDILINANSGASKVPSYGVIGNIINGGYEHRTDFGTGSVTNSIEYYKRYCDMLEVSYGDDLKYWYDQASFSDVSHLRMSVL